VLEKSACYCEKWYEIDGKLEIWGKAQRESTLRPELDWGEFKGVELPSQQSLMAKT